MVQLKYQSQDYNIMKKLPQRTLEYNIGLVKYENPSEKDIFDLTTIHSLLVDENPKFIKLCQLVKDYNSKETSRQVQRPHLQRPFVQKLYKMLSQLTIMSNSENQQKFLNKIYYWAFQEKLENFDFNQESNSFNKQRPQTASTKTRPYSAYTKPRPDSGVITKHSKQTADSQTISKKITDKYPKVDFASLKHGEKQFFLRYRTMHLEEEKPKVRLKEYQRKVFYDEEEQQIKPKPKNQLKPKKLIKQQGPLIVQDIPADGQALNQENKQENIEGQQGLQANEEDVNIDDIVAGEDDPGAPAQQEEVQEPVDKLKPRVKVYADPQLGVDEQDVALFYRGNEKVFQQHNEFAQIVQQDKIMEEMMRVWAATKNRVKVQQRRRAESARMTTKKTGVVFEKYKQKASQIQNELQIFDLRQQKAVETKVETRPISALPANSKKVLQQQIDCAMTTGQLARHVTLGEGKHYPSVTQRLCSFAEKPKKKTFQEILKGAQQKVNKQTLEEIQNIKQKLSNNKIALGANKIFKSLSHHEPVVFDGQFMGDISGKGMMKNPFFKVAKKKKKKKKK